MVSRPRLPSQSYATRCTFRPPAHRLPPGLDDRRGAGGAMSATLMRPSAMCPRSRTSSTSAVGAVAIDLQPVPATAPDRMPQGEDDVAGLFHVVQLRREGR